MEKKKTKIDIDNEFSLVSILTPSYNDSKYIPRFLKSVLNQTYKNIELIFINDGSTDNTEEVFYSFVEKFEEKNIKYKYFYQENQGQAAAVNFGLKHVSGEFLAWPDSDDELLPTSIEDRVNFLKDNKDIDVVLSQAITIDEGTKREINKFFLKDENLQKRDLIKDYIELKNIYVCSGAYLIRFEKFKEANNGLDIYIDDYGQNWQLLLPLAKNYKFGYLPKVLYNYYLKENSHSNTGNDIEEIAVAKQEGYKRTLTHILNQLNVLYEYEEFINITYSQIRLLLYFRFTNKEKFLKEYNYLKEKNEIKFNFILRKFLISNKTIYKITKKIHMTLKRITKKL